VKAIKIVEGDKGYYSEKISPKKERFHQRLEDGKVEKIIK